MWTIKIALLAAGVTLTAFTNTSTYAAPCANAPQPAAATASADTQADCLPRK